MIDENRQRVAQLRCHIAQESQGLVIEDHPLIVTQGRLVDAIGELNADLSDLDYIKNVLGHSYIDKACLTANDPFNQYWYIASRFGPVSVLKTRLEPVIAGWPDSPRQVSIHYVSSTPEVRRKGLADRLYEAVSVYCIEKNAFLCRGQPDQTTDHSGYVRRQAWLEAAFPNLRLVEYQMRDHLGDILRYAPWLAKEGQGHRWKEVGVLVKKMMQEHPDSEEVAILRTCATLSCMSQQEEE